MANSILQGSWRTTLLGLAMILGAAGTAGVAYLDSDAATVVDWEVLYVALTGGIALLFTRDNRVSSEAAGAV